VVSVCWPGAMGLLLAFFLGGGLQDYPGPAFYSRDRQWRVWFGRAARWYRHALPCEISLLQFSKGRHVALI